MMNEITQDIIGSGIKTGTYFVEFVKKSKIKLKTHQ